MINVIVADDHVIFRQGLLNLLNTAGDISVMGTAGDGRETLELILKDKPDIAILDISMPGMDGFEILEKIKKEKIGTKVLFLTMYNDILTAKKALQMNASGYVIKDNAFEDLLYAIRSVYTGGTFISPSLSDGVIKSHSQQEKERQVLTVREQEVLKLIASGLTNKQIANNLFISVKTVETHRTNIMQKLDVHTTADLVRSAFKFGLIDK